MQPISDVCKVEEGKNVFSRYFYAGNAICKLESAQKTNVLTIRLTSFEKSVEKNQNENQVQVEDLSANEEIEKTLDWPI